jgi:hypothetical protein
MAFGSDFLDMAYGQNKPNITNHCLANATGM